MNEPLFGGNAVFLAIAAFIILCIFLGVRIVPQSPPSSLHSGRPAPLGLPVLMKLAK